MPHLRKLPRRGYNCQICTFKLALNEKELNIDGQPLSLDLAGQTHFVFLAIVFDNSISTQSGTGSIYHLVLVSTVLAGPKLSDLDPFGAYSSGIWSGSHL
jgi:hypothetical protein